MNNIYKFSFSLNVKSAFPACTHVQVCIRVCLCAELFFSFCTNESRLWPPISPSPSFHLIYSMEMDFMCLQFWYPPQSLLVPSPSERSLYPQNFSTTLVGRSVGWSLDRPHLFPVSFTSL